MIVLKFGGTSVNSIERVETLCAIVKKELPRQPIVVVSALRGVTDLLLRSLDAPAKEQAHTLREIRALHDGFITEYFSEPFLSEIEEYLTQCLQEVAGVLADDERSRAISDLVVSYGERIASFLVAKALAQTGINSQQVVATELIMTDETFSAAEFLPHETREQTRKVLLPLIRTGVVPVITGFIGGTRDGRTTTLGRGGSDYSAAILGYSVNASEIQIWTDVDGIFSADPRVVPTAFRIPEVSFQEASELATFGAKVLHPRTIRPAVAAGIPVRVLSTVHPDSPGTLIRGDFDPAPRAAAVAAKPQVTVVNLYSTDMLLTKGFLKRVFAVFEKYEISIDLVSVSEVSVTVTLDNDEHLADALEELSVFTTVSVKQMGMVSLVGAGIVRVSHLMRNIFLLLDAANIPVQMISLGASAINISFVVETSHVQEAVWLLHQKIIRQMPETERNYL